MKPGLELDKVVLLGRTLDEYVRYFGLNLEAWRGKKILDVASGVSSFRADASDRGFDVTACDLIYNFSADQIRNKCEPDLDFVTEQIGKVKAYKWDFYKSPEGMRQYRERAYKKFLEDFAQHRSRYIFGELPRLPFADRQFDLSLASYLLFVYEDQFDYEFHQRSLLEILRVTSGEARFYPLVNFRAEPSSYLQKIKADPIFKDFHFEEVPTDFEFLAGSNVFLRVKRRV